ncbi:MAG: gliding motility-associated C-terminal domain-containing protein [Vicingaceae bacterium]
MHCPIRLISLFFLLQLAFGIKAQKESYNWYFGRNAGITFLPSGIPSALSNSAMNARFGSASISDSCSGQLLFYTEGDTVWNRNHQVMPNGTGLGGVNSTQSSLIVGKPQSSDGQYFVFTVGTTLNSGLSYSIIDMNLASGLGDVINGQKKIALISPTLEKVTAVRHSNNHDVWIITHTLNDNSFYAFQLSNSGVGAPVVTKVGPNYTSNDLKGYMKASPNGQNLCLALDASKRFDLYDFDNTSGVVSNQRSTGNFFPFAFGVEFSPDASKLYVTGDPTGLYQYDLSSAGPGKPLGDSTLIGTTSQIKALQLGADAKIYVNEAFNLGVVNAPNEKGALSNYQAGAIALSGFGNNALPTFLQSYFTPTGINEKNLCFGIATEFTLSVSSSVDSVLWNFGDPITGSNNTSKLTKPSHVFSNTGSFTVTSYVFTKKCGNVNIDTVSKVITIISQPIPVVDLGNDTSICPGDSLFLTTPGTEPSYQWSTGSNATDIWAVDEGIYWVRATNACGGVTDSVFIDFFTSDLNVNLGKDTNICEGDNFALNAFQSDAIAYLWNDSSNFQGLNINMKGKYWVQVRDLCEVQSDTIDIGYKFKPVVDIGNDTIICDGTIIILDARHPGTRSYKWQDGRESSQFPVNQEGFYFVNAINECGGSRGEVYIRTKDCDCYVNVPNSFTPNNDQINEYFKVISACEFKEFELSVFNRWGERVFFSRNPVSIWDGTFKGKKAASGTYTYQLIYVSQNPFDQQEYQLKGTVNLLR